MKDFKDIFTYMEKINSSYGVDTLSVDEVLELSTFKEYELLGGKLGLDNSCKHMTILETPEGISWLEGGEFLLTTGYAICDDEKAKENIILEAYKNGVSAVAIKENRYFGEISDKLINDSDKYKIPLIKIPYNVVYTETISSFYDLLFYRKNEYILNLNNIYEKLLDLTFENRDVDGIVKSLSNLSNSNVFLFDDKFDVISSSIINKEDNKEITNSLLSGKERNKVLEDEKALFLNFKIKEALISSFPVIRDNKKIAFLYLIKSSKLDRMEQRAIDYGLPIISMEIEKQMLIKLGRNKLNKTLVEMMLSNNNLPKEFFMGLEEDLGWDMEGGIVGVCIKLKGKEDLESLNTKNMIYDQVNHCLGTDNYLTTNKLSEVFIFFKLQNNSYLDDIVKTMKTCISQIKIKSSISIGVSSVYDSLSEIERLYDEAYLAALFCQSEIMYYSQLDTIKLFYPLKNNKEINIHYQKTIQKIIDYDKDNNMNLLKTLEIYFKNNMNNKDTAMELFIHVETLRYRLNRIKDITGYDINNVEDMFALKMGLKLKVIMDLK